MKFPSSKTRYPIPTQSDFPDVCLLGGRPIDGWFQALAKRPGDQDIARVRISVVDSKPLCLKLDTHYTIKFPHPTPRGAFLMKNMSQKYFYKNRIK